MDYSKSFLKLYRKQDRCKCYRNKISKLATSKKTKEVDGYWGYLDGSTFYGEGLPMYTKYMKKYAGVSSEES